MVRVGLGIDMLVRFRERLAYNWRDRRCKIINYFNKPYHLKLIGCAVTIQRAITHNGESPEGGREEGGGEGRGISSHKGSE